MSFTDITILCKVVDNFGDIGFVYRLARSLSQHNPQVKLRIVVSDLDSFALLCPEINPKKNFQEVNNWQIFNWNDNKICKDSFSKNFPKLILECFQCGRPQWLEEILFSKNNEENQICQIINIDYLTAEEYAETFHCLQSLTRSAKVKKINFMPGFTDKTGGLILDKDFMEEKKIFSEKKLFTNKAGTVFKVLCFTYELDFFPILKALEKNIQKPIEIDVANGKGKEKFLRDYKYYQEINPNTKIKINHLPFLKQVDWDKNIFNYDFLFVRGEDSLTRGALSGLPYVWNAYVQEEDYQLVKVDALLELLMPSFLGSEETCKLYEVLKKLWLNINRSCGGAISNKIEEDFGYLLKNIDMLNKCFNRFATVLEKNGDFTKNILTFIESLTESL